MSVFCTDPARTLVDVAKASRDKGKRGELEVVHVFRGVGLTAYRTAALQAGSVPGAADVAVEELPFLHVEVKRDERLSVDAMVRQAEREATPLSPVPIVTWRRNGGKWRADVPLAWLAELLAVAVDRDGGDLASEPRAIVAEQNAHPLYRLLDDGTLERVE